MSGTLLDTTENRYDAIPYHIKEWAGMPSLYINLTHDQQCLVEALVQGEYKTQKELDTKEELEYIVDINDEAARITRALLRRYNVAGK